MENDWKQYLKNKWVIMGGVVLLLFVIYIIVAMSQKSPQKQQQADQPQSDAISQYPTLTPEPTLSSEQQAAVNAAVSQQQVADREYGDWQAQVRQDYPWRKELPLHSDKYYVYFDIDSKTFFAYLYPNPGDNVDQIKAEITTTLKVDYEVPVDSYTMEWIIGKK